MDDSSDVLDDNFLPPSFKYGNNHPDVPKSKVARLLTLTNKGRRRVKMPKTIKLYKSTVKNFRDFLKTVAEDEESRGPLDPTKDHGRYHGKFYELDEKTGTVRGNPARSTDLIEVVKAVEQHDKHLPRHHAEPVTSEDMKAMIEASERIVSHDELLEAIKSPPKDSCQRDLVLRHARDRAMITFSFTVWPRYHEMAALHFRNIQLQHQKEFPYYPFLETWFSKRKGSESGEPDDGDLECELF
ncbi:hypothetical protein C0995_015476 [Termitomyces sp. Mi166|nr:hypothetical protein C0995_015476 [Termitomyces sp. Mi166\